MKTLSIILHKTYFWLLLFLSSTFSSAENPLSIARNTSLEIDALMQAEYTKLGITPQPLLNDSAFLRRAYVSILGRIPRAEESKAFLSDSTESKRHELIDSLIDSPGFQHNIFYMFADMLRLKTHHERAGASWHLWLKDAVEQNIPYDKMVYAMLSAEGHARDNPAVGYYLRDRNMLLDNVSNTVQIFLGTQIGCAQCHDDPFEDTTQLDYYQLAAFSGQTRYNHSDIAQKRIQKLNTQLREKQPAETTISRKKARKKQRRASPELKEITQLFRQFRRSEITSSPDKKLRLPHDYPYNDAKPNDVVEPHTLFGKMPDLENYENSKTAFAAWVTSRENPMFTKTIVNRLWAQVFGYGLAEPLDAWTSSTKASHPETLAMLQKVMHVTDFDVKETLRVMYHTALFQRQVAPEEIELGKAHTFHGPVLRRLSAEEIYDSYLTIEHGNLDPKQNTNITETLEEQYKYIDFVRQAPLEKVMEMSKNYQAYEEQRYALQTKRNKIRLSHEKAKSSNDPAEIKRTRALLQAVAKESKELTNQSTYTKAVIALTQPVLRTPYPKTPLRASELPAPYRPNSLLKQFGSSDRETPDASHTKANIPQVLSIFNGQAIERIADRKGRLSQIIRQADSPKDRLDALFLSIYSSYPTERERTDLLPLMDSPLDTATLVRAMLTSKRFLFLQ